MRRAVVAVALVAGLSATAAANAGPSSEATDAVQEEATAAEGPVVGPSQASPEEAALAAAGQRLGSDDGLLAEVVFRFPPPNDNDVRVRVSGDGFCAIWGAYQESPNAGWRASGEGREDLC